MKLCTVVVTLLWIVLSSGQVEIDRSGYVVFCPCMGRFGNQLDQFLGSAAFAKALNRTFVLPHFITYLPGVSGSGHVPFDELFLVEPWQEYHRVITMDQFMADVAPRIWPAEARKVYCYTSRYGPKSNDCNAKDGNPFGPYWDRFGVDFVESIFTEKHNLVAGSEYRDESAWMKYYPAAEHPVLAFVGAPGPFPVSAEDRSLQRFMRWSDGIKHRADSFIKSKIRRPFVGIHLRNGVDFHNACEMSHPKQVRLFSSPQCLGYNNEYGQLSRELCIHSWDTVLKDVTMAVKKIKAKTLFIATDNDSMEAKFRKFLKGLVDIVVTNGENPDAILDLAILTKADLFIGNCVSSYSAFVARHRWFSPDVKDGRRDVKFFAFDGPVVPPRDEL